MFYPTPAAIYKELLPYLLECNKRSRLTDVGRDFIPYNRALAKQQHTFFPAHFRFLLNQKTAAKQNTRKQSNVTMWNIRNHIKRQKTGKTKHISIVSCHYGLPDSIGKGS